MLRTLFVILIFQLSFSFCNSPQGKAIKQTAPDSITKVEMHLSAFGVESDSFPSIDCFLDFEHDSSRCNKSYYNPAIKPSTYKLSDTEMKKALQLLKATNLEKLNSKYSDSLSDQPTSTTIIYAGQQKFTIEDYGLEGEYPLKELYKLVYKY